VDGASRNNPGPAAYGVVIRGPDGAAVRSLSRYIGVKTNNEAEYLGLVAALDYATRHGITKLRVRSDSELLVRQMQGHYKVRSGSLRLLHEQARKLARHFAYLCFEHVHREQNVEADRLANQALDRAGTSATDIAARLGRPPASSAPALRDAGAGPARRGAAARGARQERETRTVRARYENGAFIPVEPLDLAEGEEVEITLSRNVARAPKAKREKGIPG